ncbi:PIN domain-containing protein [Streptomyces sp. NBC_00378]|uniref:PIN domain-containing protein n=1 Tax=unclassified Streptomyces TaxID=2593676 RepID=UPI00224E1C8E|nr:MULTISPECIES: PIN domain-containing protein [unclassified Streptomyces]MCX5115399.1 PIN domain-containing protein [Streptomyces sp. NBC_00378]
MIIFDTNALNLLPPEGPRADIIRKLRQSQHHRVAVPWMVLEEMAAHQAKFYPDKHQAVVSTLERLRNVLPWELESSLEPLDLERFLDHWRGLYGEIFEVIETSGEVARKALAREAMALPPAKRAKDHSEGARDVAIWFSILEFLKKNPAESVCFVTNNTSDFGDGTVFPYPMNEDVRGLEDRLTRLTDFDQVVSQFTKEVSGKDAEVAAGELLKSLSVRGRVAQTAVEVLSSPTGFVGLGSTDAAVEWHEWLASPEVELLSVTDVTGHEIGGDVWYTANAQWLLYGLAADGPDAAAQYVACVWEMKVLFSAHDGDETPTLLQTREPSAPDTSDTTSMELLQRLKERATGLSRRAFRNLQAGVSPAERLVAQQLSALSRLDIANGPAQRLAEQIAASRAELLTSPVQRIAQQLAANQVRALAPVQQLAEQIAASRADLFIGPVQKVVQQFAASQPKLDIAAFLPHSNFADPLGTSVAAGVGDVSATDEEGEQLSFSADNNDEPEVDPDAPGNARED